MHVISFHYLNALCVWAHVPQHWIIRYIVFCFRLAVPYASHSNDNKYLSSLFTFSFSLTLAALFLSLSVCVSFAFSVHILTQFPHNKLSGILHKLHSIRHYSSYAYIEKSMLQLHRHLLYSNFGTMTLHSTVLRCEIYVFSNMEIIVGFMIEYQIHMINWIRVSKIMFRRNTHFEIIDSLFFCVDILQKQM